jgi:hypothetical protein
LGFLFLNGNRFEWRVVLGSEDSALTAKDLAGIRDSCFRVASALALLCAFVVAARASQQDASGAKPHRAAATTSSAKKNKTSAVSKSGSKPAGTTRAASTKGKRSSSRKKKTARTRGQQKIDSERAQSIQEALIREHYLNGEATGTWNQASEDAMRLYQSDHGWQSKTVPDARALIKLGLGPSHDHLLNPESAMTTGPDMPKASSLAPVSHGADTGAPASKTPAAVPAAASNSNQEKSSPQ